MIECVFQKKEDMLKKGGAEKSVSKCCHVNEFCIFVIDVIIFTIQLKLHHRRTSSEIFIQIHWPSSQCKISH